MNPDFAVKERGSQVMQNTHGTSNPSIGARRAYVKPFVRNLDVVNTDGKAGYPRETEFTYGGADLFPGGPS